MTTANYQKDALSLMQAVNAKVSECLAKAELKYGKSFPFPTVRYTLTGVVAGRAYYYQHKIDLNATLLAENQQDFINRTVPHEVAHLIAYRVYGDKIRPHGKEWASVMQTFGLEASRCHSYDVTRSRRGKSYTYKCKCKTHQLSSIRHKRVCQGLAQYVCNKCNGDIKQYSYES
jgi:SprT protein